MEASESSILVVGPGPMSDAPVARVLTGFDGHQQVVTAQQAMTELTAGGFAACAVDERCGDAEAAAVVRAARRRGVVSFLLVHGIESQESYERALSTGCRGVLRTGDGMDRIGPMLALASEQQRLNVLEQQDLQSLQSRYESLRQRSAQQAERFQEAQETYFLDLSRVMTIFSNIMDGILFVDRDGNVTLLNPVAEDLLGVKAFAAVGKPLGSLTGHNELLQALIADHAKVDSLREVTQTVELHHTEQDLLYIKCITTHVNDYRGQAAGSLSVLKDVTAEFKSDQLKNQYLSIVAHELRTPLTGIKTFSTMMAKGSLGPLTERQQRVVESIREQSGRLEHQIDKLINLGHLESDEYGQDRERFSIAEFCGGLMAPFEQPARDRQITLDFHCDVQNEDVLFADRADLRRACQALVENAVKFTPDGGSVSVAVLAGEGGRARFSVRDTGIGIDPRYHRRVFEKFFQVEDPLTRHHGGAGLGLFVAKGIIDAHGSRIEVSSQLGSGAEFSFALPGYVPATALAAAT